MSKETKIVKSSRLETRQQQSSGTLAVIKMRRPLILIFVFGLLNSLTSFGQLDIANSVELIKKNKVKEVHIFKTNLSDTSNNKIEILSSTFTYDTIGRRISKGDFHNGILVGTYNYYYKNNSFACIKFEYISSGGQIDSTTPSDRDIFNCQQEIYTFSSKFITSNTTSGLLSVIIGYSKVLIEKTNNGNIIDKSGEFSNHYIQTIDMNEPQFILRFEYTFY